MLALVVVHGHFHSDWWASTFAVFSFYVISGFLITLIMNRGYGYTRAGIIAFLKNRALRIYPPYYAALALSLVVVAIVPFDFIRPIAARMRIPESGYDIVSNVAIFGLTMEQGARLVAPAWALNVELCHYVAIGLVLGRSPAWCLAWLIASSVYYFQASPREFIDTRYFTVLGSSLPFAVGACVYHAKARLPLVVVSPRVRSMLVATTLGLYCIPYIAVELFRADPVRWAFHTNIATSALLLAMLTGLKDLPSRAHDIDRILGDLSYPLYLFHIQAGVLALYVTGVAYHTPSAFFLTASVTLGLAILEARALSRPLESWRLRVKQRLRAETVAA